MHQLILLIILSLGSGLVIAEEKQGPIISGSWAMGGQNLENTRSQGAETLIDTKSALQLRGKWATALRGNILATAAVVNDSIFVPDYAGYLYRLNRWTGEIIWEKPIGDFTKVKNPDYGKKGDLPEFKTKPKYFDSARTTPAVTDTALYFGTQSGGPRAVFDSSTPQDGPGAWLLGVNREDGELLWKTKVETHPTARINQSAVVHNGVVYVGVTSWEETIAAIVHGYECCSFRGSVVAVDAKTGKIIWKTYMAPEGFAGNAVWSSTPVVDIKRNRLYITTGNGYIMPDKYMDCAGQNYKHDPYDPPTATFCSPPDYYFDSLVALNLDTGKVEWDAQTQNYDTHTHACLNPGVNPQNCPSPRGLDFDFAQGAMLITLPNGKQLVGAGQKSGVFHAWDPDNNGEEVWHTQVGPGGMTGGIQWGSASDGKRIYVGISNYRRARWKLHGDGEQKGQHTPGGFWTALDAATGKILWQTADPNDQFMDQGMLSVANDVVFAGSMAGGANNHNMFALDANTGSILWSFPSIGSVVAGAAIVDGEVYWGSGYAQWGGVESKHLFAFELMQPAQVIKRRLPQKSPGKPQDNRKLLPLY